MKTEHADLLFSVAGVLSPDECRALIDRGEAIGFEKAAVLTRGGPKMRTDIRDNDRIEFFDAALAADLWERCRPFVPNEIEGSSSVGLDERFRYYRYDVGQRFKRHIDGFVTRSPTVRTRLSCLFYLNEGFGGGDTVFYADEAVEGVREVIATVVPKTGAVLMFRHNWWHEGRELAEGRKYVLRSDVFFEVM